MGGLWGWLVIGGFFLAAAGYFVVKHGTEVVGWICLFGLIAIFAADIVVSSPWWSTARNIALGLLMGSTSAIALLYPPQPKFPRWTQWAILVLGGGSLLWGIASLLYLTTGFGIAPIPG